MQDETYVGKKQMFDSMFYDAHQLVDVLPLTRKILVKIDPL